MKLVLVLIVAAFAGILAVEHRETILRRDYEARLAGIRAEYEAHIAEDARRKDEAKRTAVVVEPAQVASVPPSAPAERTWTYMPGLGRYIEHDSRTSAMQSIGGGGAGPRPKPNPPKDSELKKSWGWKNGTALDAPARR